MSVITLDEAKYYLRIEDTLTPEGDAELQSMIEAAERFIERKTGYVFENREKTYNPVGCYVRIYDTPVTGDLSAYETEVKNGYILVHTTEQLAVDVGYVAPDKPPQALLNAAKQMLKVWYYESETQNNTTLIPQAVQEVINNYRRFTL